MHNKTFLGLRHLELWLVSLWLWTPRQLPQKQTLCTVLFLCAISFSLWTHQNLKMMLFANIVFEWMHFPKKKRLRSTATWIPAKPVTYWPRCTKIIVQKRCCLVSWLHDFPCIWIKYINPQWSPACPDVAAAAMCQPTGRKNGSQRYRTPRPGIPTPCHRAVGSHACLPEHAPPLEVVPRPVWLVVAPFFDEKDPKAVVGPHRLLAWTPSSCHSKTAHRTRTQGFPMLC